MPIAVKLSREFYDRFGDEAANELVGVLNTIDSNYRSELREINELNYARFDAKVGERFADLRAEMDRRFAGVDQRFVLVDQRIAELRAEMLRRFAETRLEMDSRFVALRAEVRGVGRLLKAMFAFWVPSFLAIIALLLTRR